MRFTLSSRGLRSAIAPALVALLVGTTGVLASSAGAATEEAARKMLGFYEMPFPCGQEWTGKTRSDHSPSIKAIDWNRPDDDEDDVVASGSGTVSVANKTGRSGYGRSVVVTHLNGESTLYAHLSAVVVDVGQAVDQGQLVGRVGSTGNSTGAHLHFEQRSGSKIRGAVFAGQKFAYGAAQVSRNCVDAPMAADMGGTAAAELVLFRRDKKATFQIQQPGAAPIVIPFGRTSDAPVLGDWDGDGLANVGIRRPAESTFYLSTPSGTTALHYGIPSDRPIAGDWNGDGTSEIGVHRAASADFFMRLIDGTQLQVTLGDANDIPVTGDWDGNGLTDLGVWQPGTATFLTRRAASAKMMARSVTAVQFGRPRR